MLFVFLPCDSCQFQQQLMTNSTTWFGFIQLKNHYYIKRKISSSKQKSQKEKRVVSPSPSKLHTQIDSINKKLLIDVMANKAILKSELSKATKDFLLLEISF